VNPSSTDPVTQQIQSKLGDFQRLKPFLDHKDLIGVDGVPPSPGVPNGPSSRHNPFMSNLPSSGGASSRLQPSPEPRNMEFKKPHHHQMHHQHQRGGYVKPADGKPPYEGRGGYPGQPVKHGSGITNHRSNGILPAKGPPQSSPNSSASLLPSNNSSSRIHNSGVRNHPRNTFEQVSKQHYQRNIPRTAKRRPFSRRTTERQGEDLSVYEAGRGDLLPSFAGRSL
jgi:hypothetical protein